jgi:hypothetical protein
MHLHIGMFFLMFHYPFTLLPDNVPVIGLVRSTRGSRPSVPFQSMQFSLKLVIFSSFYWWFLWFLHSTLTQVINPSAAVLCMLYITCLALCNGCAPWGDFSLCSMDVYLNSWGPLPSWQFVLNHHAVLLFLADHTCRISSTTLQESSQN